MGMIVLPVEDIQEMGLKVFFFVFNSDFLSDIFPMGFNRFVGYIGKSAISFVVFPCFTRLANWISVGVNFK